MLNRDRDGVAPVPSRVGQAGVDGQGPGTKNIFNKRNDEIGESLTSRRSALRTCHPAVKTTTMIARRLS